MTPPVRWEPGAVGAALWAVPSPAQRRFDLSRRNVEELDGGPLPLTRRQLPDSSPVAHPFSPWASAAQKASERAGLWGGKERRDGGERGEGWNWRRGDR